MADRKPVTRDVVVRVRLTDREAAMWRRAAARRELTVSSWLRSMVARASFEEYLDASANQREPDEPPSVQAPVRYPTRT